MLIGLNGKKEAGKDATYQRMRMLYGDQFIMERVAFADLIYETVAGVLGVSVQQLRRWKTQRTVQVWLTEGMHVKHSITLRELLQNFGLTHRQLFGSAFWEKQVLEHLMNHKGKLVVVTDVRMETEANLVRDYNGWIVRVLGRHPDFTDRHITELDLPHSLVDYELDNSRKDEDFQLLDEQVHQLMNFVKMHTTKEFAR